MRWFATNEIREDIISKLFAYFVNILKAFFSFFQDEISVTL